jgi:sigma-B regulation protein RsbU (phosphoserine phosphatase)
VEDEEFLAGVSVHIGLALENARMHGEIVEKRKIEQELMIAREIQQKFLATFPPSYGGVEMAASSHMCEQVGGDYIGYFPLKDGRFLVTIGDVSGKGIGAALVMTSLHATCRALVNHVHSMEHVASVLNRTLIETTRPGTFVTLLIMLVDPAAMRIHYISAGHNPPFVVDAAGHASLLEGGGGPPAGLFSHVSYKREIQSINPGSVLVIYTDGVTDAENRLGERFGMDRLIDVVSGRRQSSATDIHSGVRACLTEFLAGNPNVDDATLVVLRFP